MVPSCLVSLHVLDSGEVDTVYTMYYTKITLHIEKSPTKLAPSTAAVGLLQRLQIGVRTMGRACRRHLFVWSAWWCGQRTLCPRPATQRGHRGHRRWLVLHDHFSHIRSQRRQGHGLSALDPLARGLAPPRSWLGRRRQHRLRAWQAHRGLRVAPMATSRSSLSGAVVAVRWFRGAAAHLTRDTTPLPTTMTVSRVGHATLLALLTADTLV